MIPFIHIGQTCSFRYWLTCILQGDEPRSEGNVDGLHSKKRLIAPFLRGKCTCQCAQLLQFSVCTEGEGGSAEPLLPLHSWVGARLLHPHQLSRRRRFLTGALQKRESQRKGSHYCKKGQGRRRRRGNHFAHELKSQCGVSERTGEERRRGEARKGKARRRGAERRGEDKRGSSSLPNQIGWFSAKQLDHRQRCTVQHPLTEFWDGPGVDRIIEQMELIKLSMGTNSRTSSQSIRSGPILDVAGFRSDRVQTNTAAGNGCEGFFFFFTQGQYWRCKGVSKNIQS